MDKDTALRLALEALEKMQNAIYNVGGEHVIDLNFAIEQADVSEDAITAIKVALEEEDEPDAYGYAKRLAEAIWSKHYKTIAPQWQPFNELIGVLTQIDNMTAGLISPPQQEKNEFNPDWDMQAVLTEEIQRMAKQIEELEAQRTLVGLTDEEVADIERNSITRRQAIRAIEAKLKEKNT